MWGGRRKQSILFSKKACYRSQDTLIHRSNQFMNFMLFSTKHIWFTFQVTPYVPTIFAPSGKKVIDSNGPYISTFLTIGRNVCLSSSSSVCLPSLYRGLKYLLFTIFDSRDSLFRQGKNIDLCLKKLSKKLTAFEFGNT